MKPSTTRCALALALIAASAPALAELAVGDRAPDFTAPAWRAGEPLSYHLSDALKQGPVVLYFFPAAHTPGCNIEAHLFSEAVDRFEAAGASVIGVTAGNTEELAAFSKETEHCAGKFPVAADEGAAIARQYDATLTLKPSWSDRVSYVIAPDGTIAHVYAAMDPKQHVAQTLDAVRALQAKSAPASP